MRFVLSITPSQLKKFIQSYSTTGKIKWVCAAGQATPMPPIKNNGVSARLITGVRLCNNVKSMVNYLGVHQSSTWGPTANRAWFDYDHWLGQSPITNTIDVGISTGQISSPLGTFWNGFINGTCVIWPRDYYFLNTPATDVAEITYECEVTYVDLEAVLSG